MQTEFQTNTPKKYRSIYINGFWVLKRKITYYSFCRRESAIKSGIQSRSRPPQTHRSPSTGLSTLDYSHLPTPLCHCGLRGCRLSTLQLPACPSRSRGSGFPAQGSPPGMQKPLRGTQALEGKSNILKESEYRTKGKNREAFKCERLAGMRNNLAPESETMAATGFHITCCTLSRSLLPCLKNAGAVTREFSSDTFEDQESLIFKSELQPRKEMGWTPASITQGVEADKGPPLMEFQQTPRTRGLIQQGREQERGSGGCLLKATVKHQDPDPEWREYDSCH
ncbi:hypothetical protein MJT46_017660 [Ovis ammon polii x Ovis aries]|nr:hypothetical protein MJT46_017660 [Ovis ammon polii x Ovis aries]